MAGVRRAVDRRSRGRPAAAARGAVRRVTDIGSGRRRRGPARPSPFDAGLDAARPAQPVTGRRAPAQGDRAAGTSPMSGTGRDRATHVGVRRGDRSHLPAGRDPGAEGDLDTRRSSRAGRRRCRICSAILPGRPRSRIAREQPDKALRCDPGSSTAAWRCRHHGRALARPRGRPVVDGAGGGIREPSPRVGAVPLGAWRRVVSPRTGSARVPPSDRPEPARAGASVEHGPPAYDSSRRLGGPGRQGAGPATATRVRASPTPYGTTRMPPRSWPCPHGRVPGRPWCRRFRRPPRRTKRPPISSRGCATRRSRPLSAARRCGSTWAGRPRRSTTSPPRHARQAAVVRPDRGGARFPAAARRLPQSGHSADRRGDESASAAASFGVLVALFQWGWLSGPLGVGGAGPVEAFLPTVMLAVLFGLSMDYRCSW
ncbi:hypothetical protein SFUMM280S_05820 [Streptomyces fumanus]